MNTYKVGGVTYTRKDLVNVEPNSYDPKELGYQGSEKHLKESTHDKNPVKKLVGVEIEVEEGNSTDAELFCELWEASKCTFDGKYDGSLSSGVELVSQPMKGDIAFKEIEKVCDILRESKYKITRSCGLHIHYDFRKESKKDIEKVFLGYLIYEPYLLRMLPSSRRENDYSDYTFSHLGKMLATLQSGDLYKRLYSLNTQRGHYSRIRYSNLNLHPLQTIGTIEVRSHSGTMNARKIKNWIIINYLVMEWAKSKSFKELLHHKPRTSYLTKEILKDKELIDYYYERVKMFNNIKSKDFKNIGRFKNYFSCDLDGKTTRNLYTFLTGEIIVSNSNTLQKVFSLLQPAALWNGEIGNLIRLHKGGRYSSDVSFEKMVQDLKSCCEEGYPGARTTMIWGVSDILCTLKNCTTTKRVWDDCPKLTTAYIKKIIESEEKKNVSSTPSESVE